MKLLIHANGYTGEQTEQAIKCFKMLEDIGYECAYPSHDSISLFGDLSHATFGPAESDLVVSLGGDGSVLRAAQTAFIYDRPLLGINSGRFGFLCALDFTELSNFEEILKKCICTERSVLELTYDSKTNYVLNDVIIAKEHFGETVDLSVLIDEKSLMRVHGDGLIISTPTGSTAYNLSAGGPMLEADMPLIALTQICPHASHACPIVISDRHVVTVEEKNRRAQVYADGRNMGTLSGLIKVRCADRKLRIYSRRNAVDELIRAADMKEAKR